MKAATVYLVGAGPGDSGLITVRGRELLQRADAVVYDYLASPALLDVVPATAELVYVGKKGFSAHLSQEEINELLIEKAREVAACGGRSVVRLKGGDPCVFGRGGEEALALTRAGVPFEIVPGVTSGIAAPAYAGIPVTHRGIASTLTFVTGHEDPTKDESAVDWTALAKLVQAGGTVCFYMGMRNLGLVTERLIAEGLEGDVPVALVQWGTSARQRTLMTKLLEAERAAAQAGIGAPAVILVGEVARLRDELSWYEERPLFGQRHVVTRSRSQAGVLVRKLRDLGADVFEFPVIEFTEPDDSVPFDLALTHIASYDWVVFTSVNGVDAFFGRLSSDARALATARVAAIGPATAARLKCHGIIADAMPSTYRGEAVFEEMERVACEQGQTLDGARVLIPRAQEAREALPELLRAAGAVVDVVVAYKTTLPSDADADELVSQLEAGEIDGVTFTSSSTVCNLITLLGERASVLRKTKLFSIGPITSATLREKGFDDIAEADEYTIDGLVEIIQENE